MLFIKYLLFDFILVVMSSTALHNAASPAIFIFQFIHLFIIVVFFKFQQHVM